jgi:hypothetical protein
MRSWMMEGGGADAQSRVVHAGQGIMVESILAQLWQALVMRPG